MSETAPGQAANPYIDRIVDLEARITSLLESIAGESRPCRGCQERVYWIKGADGRNTPYTADGLNHAKECRKPVPSARFKPAEEPRYVRTFLRFQGRCAGCEGPMQNGDRAVFDTVERKVYCEECQPYVTEKVKAAAGGARR